MAARIARLAATTPGMSRSAIRDALASQARGSGRDFPYSDNTVYRWIDRAIELGLVERSGNTSGARYVASVEQRINSSREALNRPVSTRRRVTYNEAFLKAYEPNVSSYLSRSQQRRLEARCTPGSASIERLGDHDVSVFLCDLSFSSSRLEGNDYDYASTIRLIDHSVEMEGGSRTDKVMILNHHDAVRYIIDNMSAAAIAGGSAVALRESDIRALHSILSAELLKDARMCGALRTSHVEIRDSAYIPADSPTQIAASFRLILEKASEIKSPFEQALFLNVHLPYLQPFEDCNKRTARVTCNIPLLRAGVTPMSWMDVVHRDYIDGLISVYEFNDPTLLAEVFTEGYLRSTERFALMRRSKEPDQLASDYRDEIRQAVRSRVLHDVATVPIGVKPEDITPFTIYVDDQLSVLLDNPIAGARFGLRTIDLDAFRDRVAANADEADLDEDDDAGEPEFERMRA